MTVPLGHSKEKDVNVFFEAVRPKIRVKLSSNLREFQRFKFIITLRIKLYKAKPDGMVDYAEPLVAARMYFFVCLCASKVSYYRSDLYCQFR